MNIFEDGGDEQLEDKEVSTVVGEAKLGNHWELQPAQTDSLRMYLPLCFDPFIW